MSPCSSAVALLFFCLAVVAEFATAAQLQGQGADQFEPTLAACEIHLRDLPNSPGSICAFYFAKQLIHRWPADERKAEALRRRLSSWEKANAQIAAFFLTEWVAVKKQLRQPDEALRVCQELSERHGDDELGLTAIRCQLWLIGEGTDSVGKREEFLRQIAQRTTDSAVAMRPRASAAMLQIASGRENAGFDELGRILAEAPLDWLDLKAIKAIVSLYLTRGERSNVPTLLRLRDRCTAIYRELVQRDNPTIGIHHIEATGSWSYRFEVIALQSLREDILHLARQIEDLEVSDKSQLVSAIALDEFDAEKAAERLRQIVEIEPDSLSAVRARRRMFSTYTLSASDSAEALSLGDDLFNKEPFVLDKEQAANGLVFHYLIRGERDRLEQLVASFKSLAGYESAEMLCAKSLAQTPGGEEHAEVKKRETIGKTGNGNVALLSDSTKNTSEVSQAITALAEIDSLWQTVQSSSYITKCWEALGRVQRLSSVFPSPALETVECLITEMLIRRSLSSGKLMLEMIDLISEEHLIRYLGIFRIISYATLDQWRAWKVARTQADKYKQEGDLAGCVLVLSGFLARQFRGGNICDTESDSNIYFEALFEIARAKSSSSQEAISLTQEESDVLEMWPHRNDSEWLLRWSEKARTPLSRCEALRRVAAAYEATSPEIAHGIYTRLRAQFPTSSLLRHKERETHFRVLALETNRKIAELTAPLLRDSKAASSELYKLANDLTKIYNENSTNPVVIPLISPVLWLLSQLKQDAAARAVVSNSLQLFGEREDVWKAISGNPGIFLPVLIDSLKNGTVSEKAVLENLDSIMTGAFMAGLSEEEMKLRDQLLDRLVVLLMQRLERSHPLKERLEVLHKVSGYYILGGSFRMARTLLQNMEELVQQSEDRDIFARWSVKIADRFGEFEEPAYYLPILRRVVQLCPDHPLSPRVQAEVIGTYEKMGDFNSAAIECERHVQLFPQRWDAAAYVYRAAENYYKGGMHKQAMAVINKAMAEKPASSKLPDLLLLAAEVLQSEGKYDEALAKWKELVERFPAAPASELALYRIGDMHLTRQEYSATRAAWSTLMKRFPNSTYAVKVSDLILKLDRAIQVQTPLGKE